MPFGSKRVDSKSERKILRRKLWIYTIIDALVIITDVVWLGTYTNPSTDKEAHCINHYKEISGLIIGFSAASLVLDGISLFQIRKGYINAPVAVISLLIDCALLITAVFLAIGAAGSLNDEK